MRECVLICGVFFVKVAKMVVDGVVLGVVIAVTVVSSLLSGAEIFVKKMKMIGLLILVLG